MFLVIEHGYLLLNAFRKTAGVNKHGLEEQRKRQEEWKTNKKKKKRGAENKKWKGERGR